MSDYLNLLAARLSGAALTIQPRLPARFEPPARPLNLEGALPDLFAQPGKNEEQVKEAASTPIRLPVQPSAPALLDQTPLAQKPERPPSRVEPASQPAARPLPGPAEPEVTARPAEKIKSEPVRPVSRPTEAPAPETRRPEATPVRQAIEVQVSRASLSLAPLPAILPVDQLEAAAQQPLKNPVAPLVQPASLQLPRLQPAVSLPMQAAPPVSAHPETPAGHATTIQVTIGRIEVHAAPPPAIAGPRKSRSAPVMSLEEYLKQRNGEKR